ncbi:MULTISPECIES: Ms4533A family Cys-rich leader peptide [unclassified Streptomyces]
MPRCPESSDHTALELVLFGVTAHCVADILCR